MPGTATVGPVNCSGEKSQYEVDTIERKFLQNGKVQQLVADGGGRCNAGIVSVLRGICNRDHKRGFLNLLTIGFDQHIEFAKPSEFVHHKSEIALEAAVLHPSKTIGDKAVKADSRNIQRKASVDAEGVDGEYLAREETAQGGIKSQGYTEVSRQAVSRTFGENAHHGGHTGQCLSDLIYRPVTADRDDPVETVGHGASGEGRRMSRPFSVGHLAVYAMMKAGILHQLFHFWVEPGAGISIDDKEYLVIFVNHSPTLVNFTQSVMEFVPRKLLFKAWNQETGLLMRLSNIDCVKGELFRKGHILLQFTGLYDQQQEEIYEMDVVLVSGKKYVVVWDSSFSGWGLVSFPEAGAVQPFVRSVSDHAVRLCSYFESRNQRQVT